MEKILFSFAGSHTKVKAINIKVNKAQSKVASISHTSICLQSDPSLLPEVELTESQEEFVEAPEALRASSLGRQENIFTSINPLTAPHGEIRLQQLVHHLHLIACRAAAALMLYVRLVWESLSCQSKHFLPFSFSDCSSFNWISNAPMNRMSWKVKNLKSPGQIFKLISLAWGLQWLQKLYIIWYFFFYQLF